MFATAAAGIAIAHVHVPPAQTVKQLIRHHLEHQSAVKQCVVECSFVHSDAAEMALGGGALGSAPAFSTSASPLQRVSVANGAQALLRPLRHAAACTWLRACMRTRR